MVGLVEVDSKQLLGAARRLRALGGNLDTEIREGGERIGPEGKRLVSANASTTIEKRLISNGARLVASANGVRLETSGGRVRNGLNTADHGGPVEFGVKRGKKSTYERRSKRGGSHTVTRVTTNGLKPFKKSGHVFTPAVKAIVPKLSKAWTEEISDAVEDALNGGG